MTSAAYNCLTLLTNLSIKASSINQDQTVPTRAVFFKEASKTLQQTAKQTTCVVISAFKVKS